MDVVADERARNGIAAAEGDAPDAHPEDDDNTAEELPSEDSEDVVVDESTEASDLTVEDVIVDDIANDQARNIAIPAESDAPVEVIDSSGMVIIIFLIVHERHT